MLLEVTIIEDNGEKSIITAYTTNRMYDWLVSDSQLFESYPYTYSNYSESRYLGSIPEGLI